MPAALRAFPTHENAFDGMTLRDWFAGQALAFWARMEVGGWCGLIGEETAANIAAHAYIVADAMLSQREKKP